MQTKTIKQTLDRKFKSWVSSITDLEVQSLVRKNTICTGGAIASMLLGEDINDFDFYFKDLETTKAVATYYTKIFKENPPSKLKYSGDELPITVKVDDDRVKIVVKSSGVASEEGTNLYQFFESASGGIDTEEFVDDMAKLANSDGDKKDKYRPIMLTTNAITLSNTVQLIIRFYGEPERIHENFDFKHCMSYYDFYTRELVTPKDSLLCLLNRRLKYNSSKYPLCAIIRTRKFLKRGWSIDAGQYLKMAFDLNKLDLSDLNVLEDQLVGVDQAYFMEVIRLLKERKRQGKIIDNSYIIKIIDGIF